MTQIKDRLLLSEPWVKQEYFGGGGGALTGDTREPRLEQSKQQIGLLKEGGGNEHKVSD